MYAKGIILISDTQSKTTPTVYKSIFTYKNNCPIELWVKMWSNEIAKNSVWYVSGNIYLDEKDNLFLNVSSKSEFILTGNSYITFSPVLYLRLYIHGTIFKSSNIADEFQVFTNPYDHFRKTRYGSFVVNVSHVGSEKLKLNQTAAIIIAAEELIGSKFKGRLLNISYCRTVRSRKFNGQLETPQRKKIKVIPVTTE